MIARRAVIGIIAFTAIVLGSVLMGTTLQATRDTRDARQPTAMSARQPLMRLVRDPVTRREPATTTTTSTTTATPAPNPTTSTTYAPRKKTTTTYSGNSAFLRCVVQRESNGIPTVINTREGVRTKRGMEHAAGLFQFIPSTWDSVTSRMGRGDLVGVSPARASVADQWAVAEWTLAHEGRGPWSGGNYRC